MEELINAIQDLGKISWLEYIQLVATVVSIVISGFAVYYAVKIPKRIAEEQNKIALFEKRHNTYVKLSELFCGGIIMGVALFTVVDKRKNKKATFGKVNSYSSYKANEALILEASFLFNSSVEDKLNKIIQLRKLFYENENLIEEGLARFSDEDLFAYYDASSDLHEWETDTTEVLKEISNRNTFKNELEVEGCREYNVYSLENEQYKLSEEIIKLQHEVLEEIVKEMRICSSL